ncbi:optineurin-like [Clavelina lepadiformis]|uniref:NF-kappa-B essential modulator NEMO CC2-LZ domain-containing protein n=1 Tax=Clavelina lepadiformis TaxID=159417 RepID=A0ABP0GKL8_CLALP
MNMMGNQTTMQSRTTLSVGVVHSPPTDNFPSTDDYQSNATSYSQERNGVMLPYQSNSTILVDHMLQQVHNFVTDNYELRESIKTNNQILHKKCLDLQKWNEKSKEEAQKIKQNYDKARSVVMNLRDDNAMLRAENLRLEVSVMSLQGSKEDTTSENTVADSDKSEVAAGSVIQEKYIQTVENLERQLKEALSSQKQFEEEAKRLKVANNQLQQNLFSKQTVLGDLERMKQKNIDLEKYNESIKREIQVHQERFQTSERENKEVKAQLVQLVNEGKIYDLEAKKYREKVESLETECKSLREQSDQSEDTWKRKLKEQEKFLDVKAKDASELQRQVQEKSNSIDELFHEYEKLRHENERLVAQHAQTPELDNYLARLISAEESIRKKDRDLKECEERLQKANRQKDQIKKLEEDVTFFQAQADVFRQDFLQERGDREKLHAQNEKLRKDLEQYHFNEQYNRQGPMRR